MHTIMCAINYSQNIICLFLSTKLLSHCTKVPYASLSTTGACKTKADGAGTHIYFIYINTQKNPNEF